MHTTEGLNPGQQLPESWSLDVSQVTGRRPRPPVAGNGARRAAAFAAGDVAVILAAGLLSYYLRTRLLGFLPIDVPHLPYLSLFGLLLCYAMLTVICNVAYGLYSDVAPRPAKEPWPATLKSFGLSSLLIITLIFLLNEKTIPRSMVGFTLLLVLAGTLAFHYLVRRHDRKRLERGLGTQHVLILGNGQIGDAFKQFLESSNHLGKVFCGFVSATPSSSPDWLGTPDDLPRIVKERFVDEIYCTPEVSRKCIMEVAVLARQEHVNVKVVPDLYGGLALGADIAYIGNVPVLELNHQPIPSGGLFFKRLIDLVVASALLAVGSPLMLLAAVAIVLDSGGPVLYGAWRLGRKGRKFRCYKFRTMVADADARKDEIRHMNERNGATFKIANDPRITRVGRVLRKFSIDEMPQLFNVLRGEMSMVGPRPHPVDDCNQYQLQDLRRLDVLPGITGLWQVTARRDPSFERNVALDLEYIDRWNVWLDLRIILRTVPEVFRGSGY